MVRTRILVSMVAGLSLMWQCTNLRPGSVEKNHEHYCGSCHMAPDPSLLSRELWEKYVLPEMAARLGLILDDYDPLSDLTMEERHYVEQFGTYPKQQLISDEDWEEIHKFIIEEAPDSLPVDNSRHQRNDSLLQFSLTPINLDNSPGAEVTAIQFSTTDKNWLVGTGSGTYCVLDTSGHECKRQFSTAISGFERMGNRTFITEMGYLGPAEVLRGKLWLVDEQLRLMLDNLFRPVYIEELEQKPGEGSDLILCEYGNRAGRLSMVTAQGDGFDQQPLLEVPGVIKAVSQDMNDDGRKDLVVLAAQGDESIYLLYGKEAPGDYEPTRIIQLPPVYGTSWFELLDYDQDGDMDIVLVCGDNADNTFTLKPYHGLRLFLNNGENEYSESFFYPIYGATRVIAGDFDQDNDFDFAVTAMFPDFEHNPYESFVYLENINSGHFEFQSFTHPMLAGQWLVMEKGDYEGDGDIDLLLGSYLDSPAPVPPELKRSWITANTDLMLLKNNVTESGKGR